jgi:hypothetical protein
MIGVLVFPEQPVVATALGSPLAVTFVWSWWAMQSAISSSPSSTEAAPCVAKSRKDVRSRGSTRVSGTTAEPAVSGQRGRMDV